MPFQKWHTESIRFQSGGAAVVSRQFTQLGTQEVGSGKWSSDFEIDGTTEVWEIKSNVAR